MKKIIKVIGAIVENEKNEILCALPSKDMPFTGFWEFPKGKIEDGEPLEEAIVKKAKEILGCKIEVNSLFTATTYEYDDYILNLIVARCKLLEDNPSCKEHTKLLWLPIEYISSLNWNPTIIPTINKLITKYKKNLYQNK